VEDLLTTFTFKRFLTVTSANFKPLVLELNPVIRCNLLFVAIKAIFHYYQG
jgi:hypothetical protein